MVPTPKKKKSGKKEKSVMKKTPKDLKADRREKRWYGMKKVRKGQKLSWLAREDKNGWSLGLALGEGTLWLRNLRLGSSAEVKRVLGANVVLVHLKDSEDAAI